MDKKFTAIQGHSGLTIDQLSIKFFHVPAQKYVSLLDLYFCTCCNCLLIDEDLLHDVESFYCPLCLQTYIASEAVALRNCCSKCFHCPVCFSGITIVATRVEETSVIYYMLCMHCRWNSRSMKLIGETPESLLTEYRKLETDAPFHKHFRMLVDQLRLSSLETFKRHKMIDTVKDQTLALLLSNPLSHVKTRQAGNLPLFNEALKEGIAPWQSEVWRLKDLENKLEGSVQADLQIENKAKQKSEEPHSCHASISLNDIVQNQIHNTLMAENDVKKPQIELATRLLEPKSYDSNPLSETRNSISQQHRSLYPQEYLYKSLEQLTPRRCPLLIQRSKKCKTCGYYVVKPQKNPQSEPPFQINNAAILYIPQIRPISLIQLTSTSITNTLSKSDNTQPAFSLNFVIINPLSVPVKIQLFPQMGNEKPEQDFFVFTPSFEFSVEGNDELLDEMNLAEVETRHESDPAPILYRCLNRTAVQLQLSLKEKDANVSTFNCQMEMRVHITDPTTNKVYDPIALLCKIHQPLLNIPSQLQLHRTETI